MYGAIQNSDVIIVQYVSAKSHVNKKSKFVGVFLLKLVAMPTALNSANRMEMFYV